MTTSTLNDLSNETRAPSAAGFTNNSAALVVTRTRDAARSLLAAGLTSGLLLQVVLIHLIDQEWFAFAKGPSYVQTGYTITELLGSVIAVALLLRRDWWLWLAAFATAAGPFMGFLLSRSVGMPNYTDDIGNWTEPLGVASLLVEGAVMFIAGRFLLGAWRTARA